MKKVLLIFCAISLLAESAVAAQDHSTTTSSKGGQEQGTALSKQSDNSQHNKKDDAAAITSMALTNPIGAMAASWAAGKLLKLVGLQAECQTGKIVVTDPQNCPPCATDYAVKAKIAFLAGCLPTCTGPHAPACTAACYVASEEVYASTYATIESACRGEPAVNIPPTGKCVSYPDLSCAVCPASVQFKYEPFMVIWPDMSNLLVAGIKLATQGFLGHANEIIATLQGDEGHVTDKWVGPRPRNTVVKTMGDKIAVSSRSFGSLSFDASEYEGVKNPQDASARELYEYRSSQTLEAQRSLENVTASNRELLYRAQQRSIKALARAMELKKQLKVLADVDATVDANYDNLPSALEASASRRALYDALTELKLSVVASRTKLRAEAMELDFRPQIRQENKEDTFVGATAGTMDGGS